MYLVQYVLFSPFYMGKAQEKTTFNLIQQEKLDFFLKKNLVRLNA